MAEQRCGARFVELWGERSELAEHLRWMTARLEAGSERASVKIEDGVRLTVVAHEPSGSGRVMVEP